MQACKIFRSYLFLLRILFFKIHETVETSDPGAREEGQRLAQKENAEKVRQLNEEIARQEKQALEEAEQRARCEDEAQRRQLDARKREREEKEKKLKEEKEFRELKSALMEYDFQLRPRIRKESFRDVDVSDIDLVRIALIGPTGSGKTSFVGKRSIYLLTTLVCSG